MGNSVRTPPCSCNIYSLYFSFIQIGQGTSMSTFQQLQSGLRHAANDQTAAKAFLQNPTAAWLAMGGTLPPGVTSQTFAQRIAGGDMHRNIVSASQGQMSVQDFSPCGICVGTVGTLL